MAKEKDEDRKNKKDKVCPNEKYYKIKADFDYLKNFNYEVTKELGRGGYGVVYKVSVLVSLGQVYQRSRQEIRHQDQLQYGFS